MIKNITSPNFKLFKTHSEHWNQESWHCNTSHCLAGIVEIIIKEWTISISLVEINKYYNNVDTNTADIAREALNITSEEDNHLFAFYMTLSSIKKFRNNLKKQWDYQNEIWNTWL